MNSSFLDPQSLSVQLGGAPLPPALARCLVLALVRQALATPSAAELDFASPSPQAAVALRIGADLALRVGGDTLFTGVVAGVAHDHTAAAGLTLRVRAYDALHTARRHFAVRAFENVSAVDLAQQIVDPLGVTMVGGESPPARGLVLQHGESDFELLTSVAAEAGLYPYLGAEGLRLGALDGWGTELNLSLGRELLSVTVEASNERALRHVQTQGWDCATLATFSEEADLARQDAYEMHDIGLVAAEGAYEGRLLNRLADTAEEASAMAQAALDRAAASEVVARGTAQGQASLAPGRPVRLAGLAEAFCRRYVVTSVLHRFSAAAGYTSAFSTEPPVSRPRDRQPMVTHGTVTDPNDPESLGRCRVSLDSMGKLETGWLQNVVPGAGKGRGFVAFAERGDAVLVVLPDGDPARGFVLGGLYGEQLLPRGVGVHTARPFVLRTHGGQALEMARDSALARLSTSAGSLVELTPDRMRLAAATDMVIEAPGRTITIRAHAINFEQG